MTYDIENFDELEGFSEVEYSSGSSDITLVAGIKLVLHEKAVEHLHIAKDDLGRKGMARARIKINTNKKELVLFKETGTVGTVLGGKLSAVELYTATTGKKILTLIGKKLTGSGTIGFTDIEYVRTTAGIPFLVIKLESYTAKSGVFVENTNQ